MKTAAQESQGSEKPLQTPLKVEKTADSPLNFGVAASALVDPGKPAPLPHRDGERRVSERILRLADEIASLSIFEVADLNTTLKKKLNLPDTPVFAQSFATSAVPDASKYYAYIIKKKKKKN